ncbi:MAG: pyridoxine 5'-phosphate synthase [Planctomycetota bacterium]|nr:MAG: pyridoxine 5'-phosphate synthase [Planctomycetota bacterium]
MKLGVNIDHIATVRQARLGREPDPVHAAVLAELGGADSITVHLREDRRHIQDRDLPLLRETLGIPLNLEMAVTEEMLAIASALRPQMVCLVPEKREELTTEGGLAVDPEQALLRRLISELRAQGTEVSLFIDPEPQAVLASQAAGAGTVELHTGSWANAWAAHHLQPSQGSQQRVKDEAQRLERAAACCAERGITLNIGHGLSYRNVRQLLHLPLLHELNIGHAIISHALFVGLRQAVAEMKALVEAGPGE